MKKISLWLMLILLGSCKTKTALLEGKATNTDEISSQQIVSRHYEHALEYKTLFIKAAARYEDAQQTQNVTAEIRMKRDEKILVSIRFLGITMAKALITPNRVSYYEKINGTYFEGDYDKLSEWLGTELDFQKVQNLLLARPFDDLTKATLRYEVLDKYYRLQANDNGIFKNFYFESEQILLKKQEAVQDSKARQVIVTYPAFQNINQMILPFGLQIVASQSKGKTNIDVEYKSIAINEELSFPYSVPEGYESIKIN